MGIMGLSPLTGRSRSNPFKSSPSLMAPLPMGQHQMSLPTSFAMEVAIDLSGGNFKNEGDERTMNGYQEFHTPSDENKKIVFVPSKVKSSSFDSVEEEEKETMDKIENGDKSSGYDAIPNRGSSEDESDSIVDSVYNEVENVLLNDLVNGMVSDEEEQKYAD